MKNGGITLSFSLTLSGFSIPIIMAHVLPACLELRFHSAIHLTFIPAGTASRKGGVEWWWERRAAAYYLIVPAHLTYRTNVRTSITRTGPLLHAPLVPPSWVTNAVCALRKSRWVFGNRGSQDEMGGGGGGETSKQSPAAHARIPLISSTHASIAAICRT